MFVVQITFFCALVGTLVFLVGDIQGVKRRAVVIWDFGSSVPAVDDGPNSKLRGSDRGGESPRSL